MKLEVAAKLARRRRFSRFDAMVVLVGVAISGSDPTWAQTAAGSLKRFEVVSVSPSAAADQRAKLSNDPGRFIAQNIPLLFLILRAYDLKGHELTGVPDWASDEAFNIIGTYPPGPRPSDAD